MTLDWDGPLDPPEPDWDGWYRCDSCYKFVGTVHVPSGVDECGDPIYTTRKLPCKWCEARAQKRGMK